jgi:hypothetical protein
VKEIEAPFSGLDVFVKGIEIIVRGTEMTVKGLEDSFTVSPFLVRLPAIP